MPRGEDGQQQAVAEQERESVGEVISEAIADESKHSVAEGEAIASHFYVTEVVLVHDSHGADVGDVELLLTDEHYAEGETRESAEHSDTPVKETRIVSRQYDCPPMPHVLALEAWVEETGVDEYLQWGGDDA